MITWESSKRRRAAPYTLDGTINDILVYEIRPSGMTDGYDLFMHNIAGKTAALGLVPTPAYLYEVDSLETGKEMAEEHFGVVSAMLGLTTKEEATAPGQLDVPGVYGSQRFRNGPLQ